MQLNRARSSALTALTAGALALPGLAGSAAADAPAASIGAAYSFSHYREDSLPASKVVSGSLDRYEIDTHQFRTDAPIGERWNLSLDLTHETMSGASPIFSIPDAGGAPVQVMSQATIEESRTDALLTGSYFFDDAVASLSGGVSVENDFLAFNTGVSGKRDSSDRKMTLSAGAGISFDTIEPTDSELFSLRPEHEEKIVFSFFGGLSHVVASNAVLQSSIDFQHQNGFLSDPYKQVSLGGGAVDADRRPSVRNQMSWVTRYRHHFAPASGTLHADYRFYVDDWGIKSHTFDLAWYQTIWRSLQLTPSFRYYSQSRAEFYAPFFNGLPATGLASSDYRLAPFGAISYRIKVDAPFDWFGIAWRAALLWERYTSGADLALGRVSVEAPGLVAFHLFSARLSARF